MGWKNILETVCDLIFPPHCAGCGCGISGGWWCAHCAESIKPIELPRCEFCSQPFAGAFEGMFVCPNCQGRTFHFECAVAVMPSRGPVRDLIHGLKYQGKMWAAEPLADFALRGLSDPRMTSKPDFLVPVPLHSLRRRERGYNQSELLAQAISRRTNLPILDALTRVRQTTTQTHFDRKQRMKNLKSAFLVRHPERIKGRTLVLVDDVLTTGSTLDECAKELLRAGSGPVYALAIGRG